MNDRDWIRECTDRQLGGDEDGARGTDVIVIAGIMTDPLFGIYRRCDCDLVAKWCALQMSSMYDIVTNRIRG